MIKCVVVVGEGGEKIVSQNRARGENLLGVYFLPLGIFFLWKFDLFCRTNIFSWKFLFWKFWKKNWVFWGFSADKLFWLCHNFLKKWIYHHIITSKDGLLLWIFSIKATKDSDVTTRLWVITILKSLYWKFVQRFVQKIVLIQLAERISKSS